MKKYTVKFKINNDRRGASVKMYHAESGSNKFKDSNLQLNGVTTREDLRRALQTQFEFILDEMVEKLSNEVEIQGDRVQQIRMKELERTREARASGIK